MEKLVCSKFKKNIRLFVNIIGNSNFPIKNVLFENSIIFSSFQRYDDFIVLLPEGILIYLSVFSGKATLG